MEDTMKVPVFTSDNPSELQLMKAKIQAAGIESTTENAYMGFTTTPTATSLKLMVALKDEARAFEIIDEYLQSGNKNQLS